MTGPSPSETPPLRAFRLLRGQLLLDLPFHPYAGADIRVATLWPDPRATRGWASAFWEPAAYGRGFLAGAVDLGDVIGFTAEIHPPRALPSTSSTPRTNQPAVTRYLSWYGYLHEISDTALLLRGPYPHPLAAYTAAQHALIATLDQQHPGHEAALPASPPVTTSLTHTAEHTIVGDLHHGWIRVPTRRFTHALMHPPDQLRHHLTARAPRLLTGHEPPITVAAHHIPDYLSNPTPPPTRLPHHDPPTPPAPADTPPPPTVPASPPNAPADSTPQPSAPPDAPSPLSEADRPITPDDTTPQPTGPSDATTPATAPMNPAPLIDTADPTPHATHPSATPASAPTGPDTDSHDPATSTPQPADPPRAPAAAPTGPDPLPDPTPGIDLP